MFGNALMEAKRTGANGERAVKLSRVDKKQQEQYNNWRWTTDNGVIRYTNESTLVSI